MEYLLKFGLVALVVWCAWGVSRARYVFLVKIRRGRPHVARGRVTAAFLREVEDVCRRGGVLRGWLGGVPRGRRVALVFSASIPKGCQQQLRNVWLAIE